MTGKKQISAFDCALNLLSYRPRAKGELKKALLTRKFSRDEIVEALSDLERMGYINDISFIESWCYYRYRVSPRGRWLVRNELSQKGISERDLDEYFDNFYPESVERECLRELVKKLQERRAVQEEDNAEESRQKLVRKLYSKGFEPGQIFAVLEELAIQRT